MEQSFADLLTDAFSGEDEALHQEATDQTQVLSGLDTSDTNMTENDDKQDTDSTSDKEDFTSTMDSVMNMEKTPEEHSESSDGGSEQESSVSADDEEVEEEEDDMETGEKTQDWLMSVRCGEEFWEGNKEDRIFAQGQPLAPESTEKPQVRNEEQGESESDEDVSYFGRFPERGSGTILQGDGTEKGEQWGDEERVEESSDTDCEGMKIEKDGGKEGDLFTQRLSLENEDPHRDEAVTGIFELPEISVRNLQDLIADDDDGEDLVDKMKDFSGDEHQEAGESFADYPSDFSSGEFMEDGGKNLQSKSELNALPCISDSDSATKQSTYLDRGVADITWMRDGTDSDEREDQVLDTGWTGRDADMKMMDLNLAAGERDNGRQTEIDTHAAVRRCDDGDETAEPMCLEANDHPSAVEDEEQNEAKKSMSSFSQYKYTSEGDTCLRQPQFDSDSYSSSDDDIHMRGRGGEYTDVYQQDPENPLQDAQVFSRPNISDEQAISNYSSRADPVAFSISWDTDESKLGAFLSEHLLLNTEDTDKDETLPSDVSLITAQGASIDIHSVVQHGDVTAVHTSNQGSVDDSFFFNTDYEGLRSTEPGEFGDDEYEEERNWEQEQERINAFYKFYNDSEEEDGKEEREIKVQFCTNPLSQVIHYDTDSSDRDSLSSTDEGEDLSSTESSKELIEPETLDMDPAPQTQYDPLPVENVPDVSHTQPHAREHKCLGMFMLMLKLGLVILMGLLMFLWATDQLDWLGQCAFF
ncbi:dentin sialophosphoprotein isoform X2 [Myripristis murdjan]|uniref:dentin sialophosphoprotein isoform X2 n=1 Tax=Myripristis murdjan TaxID=586833 RepID=UPI001175D181|nr:dentin sialophosphoprotein-like isoform X2 [Myripristis murdjan]